MYEKPRDAKHWKQWHLKTNGAFLYVWSSPQDFPACNAFARKYSFTQWFRTCLGDQSKLNIFQKGHNTLIQLFAVMCQIIFFHDNYLSNEAFNCLGPQRVRFYEWLAHALMLKHRLHYYARLLCTELHTLLRVTPDYICAHQTHAHLLVYSIRA